MEVTSSSFEVRWKNVMICRMNEDGEKFCNAVTWMGSVLKCILRCHYCSHKNIKLDSFPALSRHSQQAFLAAKIVQQTGFHF